MSNGLLRILTALIGVPLVLGTLYLGGWPFVLLVASIALLAQAELYGLFDVAGLRAARPAGLVLGGLLVIRTAYAPALLLAIVLTVLVIALSPLVRARRSRRATERAKADRAGGMAVPAGEGMGEVVREGSAEPARERSADSRNAARAEPGGLAATVFGAVYPAGLLGFLAELRYASGPGIGDSDAFILTLTVILLVWATDTFAYYTGRSVGRRPLAPTISPKKTWEGAIGGTIGALLVAVILRWLALDFLAWGNVVAVALLCSILGQAGDLAESRLKRAVGVKDSGTLLPGHGGMLDRFDAMIVVAPAVYLYLRAVGVLY